jgi:TonB family protein
MKALLSLLTLSFLVSTLCVHAEVGSFKVVSPTIAARDCIRITSYMLGTSKRIDSAWSIPLEHDEDDELSSSPEGFADLLDGPSKAIPHHSLRSIVRFTIAKDGTVSTPELTQSSGDTRLDGAALTAVQNSAPFARLPDGFSLLTVDYTFRPADSEVTHGSLRSR